MTPRKENLFAVALSLAVFLIVVLRMWLGATAQCSRYSAEGYYDGEYEKVVSEAFLPYMANQYRECYHDAHSLSKH